MDDLSKTATERFNRDSCISRQMMIFYMFQIYLTQKRHPKKYLSCLKLNSKPACMANPSAPISDILLSAALLASNFKGNFLVGNSNTCQRQSNKSVFSGWAALPSICTSDLKNLYVLRSLKCKYFYFSLSFRIHFKLTNCMPPLSNGFGN